MAACGRSGFDTVFDAGASTDDGGDGGGLPAAQCPIPPRPDVSTPTRVVSTCTETEARNAIAAGGIVAFACPSGTTIPISQPLIVVGDVIIAGNGVTFDGQLQTSLLQVNLGARLTLLDTTITGASSMNTGGAIRVEFDGALVVYDSVFTGNQVTGAGQGGGAIGAVPNLGPVEIYRSHLEDNAAPNGGAVQGFDSITIMSSVLLRNRATGTDPNGAGGAINASGNGDLVLCDVTIEQNTAGFYSGGIHRVSVDSSGIDRWDRVRIVSNSAASIAGGTYVEDVAFTMRQSEVVSNQAPLVGGLWFQGTRGFDAENVSISDNLATTAIGAGLRFMTGSAGRLAFATIANNNGQCPGCFSSGLEGADNISIVASVIADNAAGTSPITCRVPAMDGGSNFQWPVEPDLCTPAITFVDPLLAPQAELTGPAGRYRVRKPMAGTPLTTVTAGCPAEDILGYPRPLPCTAGAVEP